jgi:integrase
MKRNNQKPTDAKPEKVWRKTSYSNLIRYVPSGTYFARLRVKGKLIRKTLKTDVLTVAKLRLGDFEKEERRRAEAMVGIGKGKLTVGDAMKLLQSRIDSDVTTKPRTKLYYRERIAALLKSWPGLDKLPMRDLNKSVCLTWAADYSAEVSATSYNNTVTLLRDAVEIAMEHGVRYDNPALAIRRVPPQNKKLTLPTQDQFQAFLTAIENCSTPWASRAADLVRFLAYTGCRKNEAANVTWGDLDFERGNINLRVTKNGHPRSIPMIDECRNLLEKMRAERPKEPDGAGVNELHECQVTMDAAAAMVGMARITHHDLRHLFATRCIESGVDIPTVSRWLGHRDGGALAMKVYGHLRDQHSTAMAKKVSFAKVAVGNVIPMAKESVA